ncbi:UNVERIFIED_CONTAM: hypothetical protein Scaly_1561500 [Sesamum calycinum]|uniref:Uncharacterized protein n=1 Tax=Sesamum calycinum TaxID=2727403 RepID=A0AAW2P9S0_9LAMI
MGTGNGPFEPERVAVVILDHLIHPSISISARHRARLRKEVLLAGSDWPYDPERKEMRTKRKGHKVDRLAAEKRERTAELMEAMPQMLADYRKRVGEKDESRRC